jgi:hypothetical protein
MIGNSWTSAEMFLGWTFGWKWFPFIYGGQCLCFSIAWISPQWSYCWLIIYASLYGMRKENAYLVFKGFSRLFLIFPHFVMWVAKFSPNSQLRGSVRFYKLKWGQRFFVHPPRNRNNSPFVSQGESSTEKQVIYKYLILY